MKYFSNDAAIFCGDAGHRGQIIQVLNQRLFINPEDLHWMCLPGGLPNSRATEPSESHLAKETRDLMVQWCLAYLRRGLSRVLIMLPNFCGAYGGRRNIDTWQVRDAAALAERLEIYGLETELVQVEAEREPEIVRQGILLMPGDAEIREALVGYLLSEGVGFDAWDLVMYPRTLIGSSQTVQPLVLSWIERYRQLHFGERCRLVLVAPVSASSQEREEVETLQGTLEPFGIYDLQILYP